MWTWSSIPICSTSPTVRCARDCPSCYTVYTEKQLSEGRADCIVETPQYIYIFEFKLDGTAAEALQQIHDKGYARAYDADERKKYLLGVSFSSKTGTTEEWQVESL